MQQILDTVGDTDKDFQISCYSTSQSPYLDSSRLSTAHWKHPSVGRNVVTALEYNNFIDTVFFNMDAFSCTLGSLVVVTGSDINASYG